MSKTWQTFSLLCVCMVLSTALAQQTKPAEPELMNVVYFLDPSDQTLKPLPKDPAKVVTKHSGLTGAKGYIQIPGSTSSFRLKSGQDLEFVIKCTNPESYELYPFATNKDKREAMVSTAHAKVFGNVSLGKKSSIDLAVSKYGEMSYKFVIKAPEPGQYGFAVGWTVYNFGVDPK
jgi:uncharacterized cupredoxin-like copper-binding protein